MLTKVCACPYAHTNTHTPPGMVAQERHPNMGEADGVFRRSSKSEINHETCIYLEARKSVTLSFTVVGTSHPLIKIWTSEEHFTASFARRRQQRFFNFFLFSPEVCNPGWPGNHYVADWPKIYASPASARLPGPPVCADTQFFFQASCKYIHTPHLALTSAHNSPNCSQFFSFLNFLTLGTKA